MTSAAEFWEMMSPRMCDQENACSVPAHLDQINFWPGPGPAGHTETKASYSH